MAVLIENSAYHGRSERSIGERPIGNRKAGVIGGDQSAGNEQEEGACRSENGETVDVLRGAWGH